MNIPIILNPGVILNRGNDLTEFFWPILYWTKKQILTHHQIPLWNSLHLSGTPLVSDPQAPIFYPINAFALLMSLDSFFIFSFILHALIGGVGMFLCSKQAFKFSKKTSLVLAFLYIFTPKFFAYLEAGHVGLVYSFAWIPFILLAAINIRPILLGVSLALLYYSHLPTFLIVGFAASAVLLWKKKIKQLAAAAILTFILTAFSLVPQILWQGQSTRYLLLENPDVYPKWSSIFEAARAVFTPNIDSEKVITLGFIPFALSFLGFLTLKKKQKIIALAFAGMVGLVILNNASPIYSLLLKQDWFLLLRVSTRFWILIILLSIYLTGKFMEKHKSKFVYLLAVLGVIESIYWGVNYFKKPINKNPGMAPGEVYEYLSGDKSLFRVYCTTRCLSQKEAAIYGLELLDGYSTVQQKNFYRHAWQLTNSYWNYYTLSIPPLGTYLNEQIQPSAKTIGEYNVNYVISPHALNDKNFKLVKKIEGFYIYQNPLSMRRDYEIYTPNFIRVKIKSPSNQLTVSEVYSPGWRAYLNGNERVLVQETPNALRAVNIKPDTKFVDLKYEPYKIVENSI